MTEAQQALEAAVKVLITDRDGLYEAISLADGPIPDADDKADLDQLDAVIDRCQAALAETDQGN